MVGDNYQISIYASLWLNLEIKKVAAKRGVTAASLYNLALFQFLQSIGEEIPDLQRSYIDFGKELEWNGEKFEFNQKP